MRVDWAGWALFGLLATTTIAIMIVAQVAGGHPARALAAAGHDRPPKTRTELGLPDSSSTWALAIIGGGLGAVAAAGFVDVGNKKPTVPAPGQGG